MKFTLENKEYTFEEFINNDLIHQGVVELKGEYQIGLYNLLKIKNIDGGKIILYKKIYWKVDRTFDSSCEKFEFLVYYNKERKIALYDYCYGLDSKKILPEVLIGYSIYDVVELAHKIKEEFIKISNDYLDKNIDIMLKDENYKKQYDYTYKKDKEFVEGRYCINQIEDSYFNYFRGIEYSDDLNKLLSYLVEENFLLDMIKDVFNKSLESDKFEEKVKFAGVHARRKMLKDIEKNPSNRVKIMRNIKDIIGENWATFEVELKDGESIRVANSMNMYGEFSAVKGYKRVSIDDITNIKYRNKVVCNIEEFLKAI